MLNPRNLILGLWLTVFVSYGYAQSDSDVDGLEKFTKFFKNWNTKPVFTNDLLIERPLNASAAHLRSKRSLPDSQDYPVNFNGGSTRCWIPGYTGAHCEFPICDQFNRHDHGPPQPTPVGIEYNYHPNATSPSWFNVDSTIWIIIIKLESDTQNDPRAQVFDELGNEIGSFQDIYESNGRETTYRYDRTGLPGTYRVQPFSLSNNNSALRTMVSGVSDIGMDIEIGFVPNFGNNQPERSDYPSTYPYQRELNVVVADVKFLEIPGSLATVTIYSQSSELTVPSPLRVRYGCSYKYYFDSFYCRDFGQYYAKFDGYDFFGYSFTRWASFTCLPAPETTPGTTGPTSPPPTSPTTCLNDGVLITRTNGSTYCYCQGMFAGTQCEIILCANGGTIMPDNTCLCSDAWGGNHCEYLWCEDDAGLGYLGGEPMVLFVIRLRSSTAPVIGQIRDQILNLQANFSFNPEYFKHFAIAFFNNNQFLGVTEYRNVDQIITILNISSQNTDTSGGCSDASFTAIWELVNQVQISKKSPIYVFTDALPDDAQQYQETINQRNSYWNAPINFIFLDTDPTNCPIDQFDPAFRAMNRLAERSSGLVHFVQNANIGSTGQLFFNLIYGTYFKGHLVYIDDERSCSNQPLYETISIDSNDRFWKLTLLVIGDNITISLVDPDQNNVQFDGVYQLGRSYVFQKIGFQTGTWTFAVVSGAANTPCNFRVWALESPLTDTDLYTDYNLMWGTTPWIGADAPFREPAWNRPVHIVAHIDNYPNTSYPRVLYPEYVNAELTVHAQRDEGRQLVLASNGIWRSGCSMQLFFPVSNQFTCQRPDEILYLTIYVRDPRGYMIQRAGVFYCNFVFPTQQPSPSAGACLNSGIFYNNTCICTPDWTGQYCEQPVCYNGGSVVAGQFCNCPAGTGGPNCQFLRCTQLNPRPGFDTLRRSLAFLLDVTKYNAGTLSNLARNIQQTISDIRSQHREWIENYYVYAFDSQNITLLVSAQPYDEGSIVAAFNQAANMAAGGDSGCRALTHHAILTAIPSLNRNSFIYVYQTALPEERDIDIVRNASFAIDQARHMLMVYGAQDDPAGFGPYPICNATFFDYDILAEMAELSQGRFFNLRSSSFMDTLKLLPTMYESGVVYRKVFPNCTTANTVFAPVDTYAQSMQIIIHSQGNVSYTITRPDGKQVDQQYVGSYLNDVLNGWTALDIRRGCDDDWENLNNPNLPYCYNVRGGQQNWTWARDFCWAAGGYLLDDSTPDLDNVTNLLLGDAEFWIGLNNVNSTNGYFWDRGRYNPPATLNTTVFNNWGQGQPVNDPTKQCVYRKSKWFNDNCSTVRSFVCMKHKYTASYNPNSLDDYDLPAGRWAITLSGATGFCSVEVKVQSPMQIFTGYTNDLHSDFPTPNPYRVDTKNRNF